MKNLLTLLCATCFFMSVRAQCTTDTIALRQSLDKAIIALTAAFAKGDAAAVARLHHPDVVKYFGGTNVVTGRAALEQQLTGWFSSSKVEFIENTIESTVFSGETAIQCSIFAIRNTPKNGGAPVIARGRSMVIYVKDASSPSGWLTLREMTQAAPDK
ncbi:YybH family protein [Deminuibacter soli]|uniref:Nuclear transport factor 2 family protein n=1 Tax=Deminuibacter soli TaxID=2291815 RepID=A0A3E1NGD4_9BACT|nr:nuclear transport factor 2 family protein [Deminuibacter soli]RFM27026.1 nuclear transport factor 2 family protein [Deminuibacter soli]